LRKRDGGRVGRCGRFPFPCSWIHYLSLCLANTYAIAPLQEYSKDQNPTKVRIPRISVGGIPPRINTILWKSPQWQAWTLKNLSASPAVCNCKLSAPSCTPRSAEPPLPAAEMCCVKTVRASREASSPFNTAYLCFNQPGALLLEVQTSCSCGGCYSERCLGFAKGVRKEPRPLQAICPQILSCPDVHSAIVPPRKWLQSFHCSLMRSITVFTPSSLNKEAACEASNCLTSLTLSLSAASETPLLPPVLGDSVHQTSASLGGRQVSVTAVAGLPLAGCWCQSDDVGRDGLCTIKMGQSNITEAAHRRAGSTKHGPHQFESCWPVSASNPTAIGL